MCQNNSDEKSRMLEMIANINAIEGFDPSLFAVEYADSAIGEKRKRLPVVILISMFRMKYPEGKITVKVTQVENSFVATARIYPNYKNSENEYLAEATVTRDPIEDKPLVSVMEWAQTSAIGVALRNAGFGLQYFLASEDFCSITQNEALPEKDTTNADTHETTEKKTEVPAPPPAPELSPEERYQQALGTVCTIKKHEGRTLHEILSLDPGLLKWLAEKYVGEDKKLKEAAKIICDYAISQKAA